MGSDQWDLGEVKGPTEGGTGQGRSVCSFPASSLSPPASQALLAGPTAGGLMARVAGGLVSKEPWRAPDSSLVINRLSRVLAPWPTLLPGKTLPSMKEALTALERPQGRVPTAQLLPMGALPGWQVAQLQAETQAALYLVPSHMSLHLAVGWTPALDDVDFGIRPRGKCPLGCFPAGWALPGHIDSPSLSFFICRMGQNH